MKCLALLDMYPDLAFSCALGEIRTHTARVLNPAFSTFAVGGMRWRALG